LHIKCYTVRVALEAVLLSVLSSTECIRRGKLVINAMACTTTAAGEETASSEWQ